MANEAAGRNATRRPECVCRLIEINDVQGGEWQFMPEWITRPENRIMPRNEGTIDRALRVILGLVLISLVFVGPQTMWGWVGVVPLLTGLVGFCPLYRLVGINTCPMR